jgi:uncharacterized protein
MIVADTSALSALIDSDDRHHASVRSLYEKSAEEWLLPWAVFPAVDYLVGAHVGPRAQEAFVAEIVDGSLRIEWGEPSDLARAADLCRTYRSMRLGLVDGVVDGVVVALAERLRARAIATLDMRHFGAIAIRGRPRLLPRDV